MDLLQNESELPFLEVWALRVSRQARRYTAWIFTWNVALFAGLAAVTLIVADSGVEFFACGIFVGLAVAWFILTVRSWEHLGMQRLLTRMNDRGDPSVFPADE
jgi:hypothetical protein